MPAMTGVGYFAHCRAGDHSPFRKHQELQEVNHLEKPVLVQQTGLEHHELCEEQLLNHNSIGCCCVSPNGNFW